MPVHTKITSILLRFRHKSTLNFRKLFDHTHSRSEIVATFLAVLELSKNHRIEINGEGDDINLSLYTGGEEENIREERIS